MKKLELKRGDRVLIKKLIKINNIKMNLEYFKSAINTEGTFWDKDNEYYLIILDIDEYKTATPFYAEEIEKIEGNKE